MSKIRILVEGLPLRNSQNEEVGLLDNDSFVENSGKEINTYENATMTLYFTNESGDGLTAEQRNIYYSTNVPLERVVVEQLGKGPGAGRALRGSASGAEDTERYRLRGDLLCEFR